MDALIKEGLVDPDRLAVAGYSYGGYMTSWTIGHSDRFKAAAVGAPVVNFESFHGTSDIGMKYPTDTGMASEHIRTTIGVYTYFAGAAPRSGGFLAST